MQYNTLLTEVHDSIVFIKINRPDRLNAINPEVLKEINGLLDAIEIERDSKVVVITGNGDKSFVVGNDLDQLSKLTTVQAYEQMRQGQKMCLKIHQYPKPIIAMVNGYSLGGGFELALSCDLIIASDTAKFGFPEINLNTMPGWGGTQLAAKKFGLNKAKEMIFTGKKYSANSLQQFGVINKVVQHNELKTSTLEIAKEISAKEPFPLKMAKSTINLGQEIDVDKGFQLEAQAYAVNFSNPHVTEGFNRFLKQEKG